MPSVDEAVLRDPVRLAAVARARRVTPALPMPLNAVAGLAARLLDAPMGVVTFVGAEEEHFAGVYRLPASLAGDGHAPIAYSLCKYMVSQGAPVCSGDMTAEQDAELREHLLAVRYGVRAFMGVPLRDAEDRAVGSVSVLDTAARGWSDGQLSTLMQVAQLLDPLPVDEPAGTEKVAGLSCTTLLDSLQEAFLAVGPDGTVAAWNRAAGELLGWRTTEVCGRPLAETVLPDYGGRPVGEALDRLFAAPSVRQVRRHTTVRHRDGHDVPVQLSLSLLRGAKGALACAFITDRSSQVSAESDAEQQRGFLAALLDSLSVGVVACDPDGEVVLLNTASRRLLGLPETGPLEPAHAAAGVAMLHHVDGTPMRRQDAPLLRSLRGEHVHDADMVIRAPGPRSHTFAANGRPILGADGRLLGAVVAAHDVTAVRRAERFRACHTELTQLFAGADSAAQVAPAFVRTVATALGWPRAELWLADRDGATLQLAGRVSTVEDGAAEPGRAVADAVWRSGKPLWVPDLRADAHPYTGGRTESVMRSCLAVPVRDGDTEFGVLSCYAETLETPEDLLTVLLDGVAAELGQFLALRRAKRLAAELTAAGEEAQAQRGFVEALLDSLQVGVLAWDADGQVARCNRTVREMFGLPASLSMVQFLHEAQQRLYHPDGAPVAPGDFGRRALQGEDVRDVELVVGIPGTPRRYLSVNAQPILGADGRQVGAIAAISDVTQRRRTECFRACELDVARTLAGAVDLAEAGPRLLETVTAALGWPMAELCLVDEVSETLRTVTRFTAAGADLAVDLDAGLDAATDDALRRGEGISGTVWATGNPVWVPDLRHSPLLNDPADRARAAAYHDAGVRSVLCVPIDDGAKVVGVLAGFADTNEHDEPLITGLLTNVAGQLGLVLARLRADELGGALTRAREDFVALVGHDMRTPLTTIAACAQLLLEDPVARPEMDLELLRGIDRNSSRLRMMVDGLLDLAALEAGHLAVSTHEVDFTAAVAAACDAVHETATSVRVTVRTDLTADIHVPGDAVRLRQLAARLVSHAIGCSPDGGEVRVALSVTDGAAQLTVTDSGTLAERGDIFQRFSAANSTGVGDTSIGVGLAIARIITERHRGTIAITDQSDGTTITVRLPLHGTGPHR